MNIDEHNPPHFHAEYSGKEEFRPMYQQDFKEVYSDFEKDQKEWYQEYEAFENGKVFELTSKERIYSKANGNIYEDWAGKPPSSPSPYGYMPKGEWYQLFETVSEGTPLSPPFKTKEELVEWLVNNKDFWDRQWTRPQAEGMVKSGWAPSGIMANGKFYRSEQAVELQNKD